MSPRWKQSTYDACLHLAAALDLGVAPLDVEDDSLVALDCAASEAYEATSMHKVNVDKRCALLSKQGGAMLTTSRDTSDEIQSSEQNVQNQDLTG